MLESSSSQKIEEKERLHSSIRKKTEKDEVVLPLVVLRGSSRHNEEEQDGKTRKRPKRI